MKLPTLLSLFLCTGRGYGQSASDDFLKKLILKTQHYQSAHLYEKVHVHLDKPFYAIGDDIWFKAYVVQAENNQPSNLSKILYVDLINERDSIEQTLRLPLLIGLAWGKFTLSDKLTEGNYRVRAYTNWMRNFGEEYFFDKTIPVGNVITNNIVTAATYTYSKEDTSERVTAMLNYKDLSGNAVTNKEITYEVQIGNKTISKSTGKTDNNGNLRIWFKNQSPSAVKPGMINTTIRLDENRVVAKNFAIMPSPGNIDLQFFPEGGDLVGGLTSIVAFKATGSDGRGVPVRGYLTDQENNRITAFRSEHLGMGTFVFRPKAAMSYKAVIEFEDGTERTFKLPEIQPKGLVLSVANSNPDELRLSISSSPEFAGQEITVLAQSNNKIHFAAKSMLIGTRLATDIPTARFPEGILHITLFSTQNEPLAERLVFINHRKQLKIDLNTAIKEYSKREKVQLSLNVTDSNGNPVLGSFSVAVVDESKVPYEENNETTILSNLLLTSDLKGYVQSPNYYFTSIDDIKARHLDHLMLTHGWRRFTWKSILNEPHPTLTYRPEQSMSISGKITRLGKPVENGKVTLFYSQETPIVLDTVTDENGQFRFKNLYPVDRTKLVVQARDAKDRKDVKIELDQVPPQLVTENENLPDIEWKVASTMINYLKNSALQFDSLWRMNSGSIALAEVKIIDKKIDIPYSTNLNGAGNADAVIKSEKLTRCLDLSICLENMVSGVVMVDGTPVLTRNMLDPIASRMLIIVDGLDTEWLATINPHDIEAIEVLKSGLNTAIYGPKGRHGILLITTKRIKSNMEENPVVDAPGMVKVDYQGFYKVREFYSPDYSELKINPPAQDLRTTIYWKPQVITNDKGKALVEFFNADGTGDYRVIVEGINEAGQIGRSVYRYTVK